MRKKKQCCKTELKTVVDFRVEALVSVDARGQMVLPKDLREKTGIRAGDKLVLVSWLKDGRVCCLGIVKLEELTDILKERLGPILKEIIQEE